MKNYNHVTQLLCTYTTLIVVTTITIFSTLTKATIDKDGCIEYETITEICDVYTDTVESLISVNFTDDHQSNKVSCQAPHPVINGDFTVSADSRVTYALSSNYEESNTYTWSVVGSANIISGQGSSQVEIDFTQYDGQKVILRIIEETESGTCSAVSVVVIDVDGQFIMA